MRRNIVGLVVCLVIFSSAVISVASMTDGCMTKTGSNHSEIPIWEIGDKWTYHYTESVTSGLNYSFSGTINLKVVDDSEDSYVLKGKSKPRGAFFYEGMQFKSTIFTTISMRLQVRKNDLGFESFEETIEGIFFVKIGPITLPIPFQAEKYMNIEFDPTWEIMPFPLYDGKNGNLSGTEVVNIEFIVNMLWGKIPLYNYKNFAIIIMPVPYTCSAEQITVDAGKFDVINVSAICEDGSRFISYYSDEVGNIVKEEICKTGGGGTVWHHLILELKDWSYTP